MSRERRQRVIPAPSQHPTDRKLTGTQIEVVDVSDDHNLSTLAVSQHNPSKLSGNITYSSGVQGNISEQIIQTQHTDIE